MNEQTNTKFEIGKIYGQTWGTGCGYDCFESMEYVKVHKRTDKTVWISRTNVSTVKFGVQCAPVPIDHINNWLSDERNQIVRRKIHLYNGVEYINLEHCCVGADDLYE